MFALSRRCAGGFLQILLFILLAALTALGVGAPVPQGMFVGALLSMSSTSIVIKCLDNRARASVFGQITVGTLLLQDCCVGLMFALLPLFGPNEGGETQSRWHAASVAVPKVLAKLLIFGSTCLLVARFSLPCLYRQLQSRCSKELWHLTMVRLGSGSHCHGQLLHVHL